MLVKLSLVAGIAAIGYGTNAEAQARDQQKKESERAKTDAPEICVGTDRDRECRVFRRFSLDSVLEKRAALGVHVGSTGSPRDTLGVFVTRVTAKGPAENAGIVEGDRIVSINGVDLRVNSADAGDSYASGLPARRLTREVQKLSPGAVANLRIWSGGRIRDVRVTTGRASDLRDGGMFGTWIEGMPDAGVFRDLPLRQLRVLPRTHIESFPRTELDRIRLEDLSDRIRERVRRGETEYRLRARPMVRVYSPSRASVLTTTDPIVIDDAVEVLVAPSKKEPKDSKKKK